MFKQSQVARRNTVTVEDRRAVLILAQVRKPRDVAEVSHENFIRNSLKDRLQWPRREPAPECVKAAAKHLATQLQARDKLRFETEKACIDAQLAKEAEQIAIQAADQERWEREQDMMAADAAEEAKSNGGFIDAMANMMAEGAAA